MIFHSKMHFIIYKSNIFEAPILPNVKKISFIIYMSTNNRYMFTNTQSNYLEIFFQRFLMHTSYLYSGGVYIRNYLNDILM